MLLKRTGNSESPPRTAFLSHPQAYFAQWALLPVTFTLACNPSQWGKREREHILKLINTFIFIVFPFIMNILGPRALVGLLPLWPLLFFWWGDWKENRMRRRLVNKMTGWDRTFKTLPPAALLPLLPWVGSERALCTIITKLETTTLIHPLSWAKHTKHALLEERSYTAPKNSPSEPAPALDGVFSLEVCMPPYFLPTSPHLPFQI